ncbi:MAG: hypothetical protein QQN45_08510 [Nitrosopumilus sp.]
MAKDTYKEDTDNEDSKLMQELMLELYIETAKVLKKIRWYL